MSMTVRSIVASLAVTTLLAGASLAKGNPKMAECNKQSAGKTGEERKKFMSECLAAKPEKKLTAQQQKMKDCNEQGKGMKGKERKEFMKTCLSAK